MREKLNSNPLAQVVVAGVLLVVTGFFVLSAMGGGEDEGGEEQATISATATVTATLPVGAASAPIPVEGAPAPTSIAGAPDVPSPPLPRPVRQAFAGNRTVVLLIRKKGAYDDSLVVRTVRRLRHIPRVSVFIVPARQIARYAAITQGVDVDRVPALVVVRPRHLDKGGVAIASVSYGVQSFESVRQAIRDARYKGVTLAYHP
jgi:hypothetical protein